MSNALTRREFAAGTVSAAVAATLGTAWSAPQGAGPDLAGTGRAMGWDPSRPGAFLFAHVTDTHVCEAVPRLTVPHKFEGRSFVDDLNALAPRPKFVALTGDLVSGADLDEKACPDAAAHFATYRRLVTDRLTLPFHQILGNNDCSSKAYHAVFPDRPVDWTFESDGIAFAGLHGYNLWTVATTNHAGCIYDDAQLARLAAFVEKTTARTLVLFTHEGLPDADQWRARMQLDPVVARFRGEAVWNVAGHSHYNSDGVITIGARPVRCLSTQTPIGSWKPGDGGYRVFFAQEGRIVGSALRWLTVDGAPLRWEPSPDWTRPRSGDRAEHIVGRNALAAYLVGMPNERAAFRETKGAVYRLTNYHTYGSGRLTWEFPSSVGGRRVRGVVVSGATYGESNFGPAVKQDGRTVFPVPEQSAGTFLFTLANRPKGGLAVYWLALV